MVGDGSRLVEAERHVGAAIELLLAAQSRRLDHTDGIAVRDALECLAIVRRAMTGIVPDDAKIATRLREVAIKVRSCVEKDASVAYADVTQAAEIFQTIAEGKKR
jgi:hypothetical protein